MYCIANMCCSLNYLFASMFSKQGLGQCYVDAIQIAVVAISACKNLKRS